MIEAPHPGGSVRVAPVVPVVAILSAGWEAWMDLQEYGSTTRLPGTTCSLCSAVDCGRDASPQKLEGRVMICSNNTFIDGIHRVHLGGPGVSLVMSCQQQSEQNTSCSSTEPTLSTTDTRVKGGVHRDKP